MTTMYDKKKPYFATLMWDDIFKSSEDFERKVVSVGGSTNLDELYDILSNKYLYSSTRYTTEQPFIMAIRRELQIFWPNYLEQKSLLKQMQQMEIDEIMKAGSTLRNVVNNPNDPTPNADTVPIRNLSTEQENIRQTTNKLDAVKAKYNAISRNYLQQIYKATDQLFTVILADETFWLYPQGE